MSESQRGRSIAPRGRPLAGVPASPFNGVKLGLVLVLLSGVVLTVVVNRLAPSAGMQLAVLGGYGLGGMGWAVLAAWRILRQFRRGANEE